MTLGRTALAAGAIAAACGTSLPHPPYSPHQTTELLEVPFPPPPARVELVPERPRAGALWIDGQWVWRGRRWAWVAGYWAEPASGETFSPWQVTRDELGTLYFAPSAWRDAEGRIVAAPPPLRLADTRAGSVVGAEGETERTGVNLSPDGGRLRPHDAGAGAP